MTKTLELPGARIEYFGGDTRPLKPSTVTIKITPEEREKIDSLAKQRGISPEDMAGRVFRSGLKIMQTYGGDR